MIRREILAALGEYFYKYGRLAGFWKRARESILDAELPPEMIHAGGAGLAMYEVEEQGRADDSPIYFHLAGVRCYVAFTHDLDKGFLEYGVVDPTDQHERRRIKCSALQFDESANLGEVGGKAGPWSVVSARDVSAAHFSLLSKIAPDLVKAFYGAYHDER